MRTKRYAVAGLLFLLFFIGSTAWGVEWEDIAMHGFVSQGYLRSTENYYLGNSKKGSYEYNEVGLNFSVPVSDMLRFGIQIFTMDLGEYANNEFIVDWAFLDYTWRDWLGFRAGKIKLPLGLYNRQRDADTLRTAIILPQSVYNEGFRYIMSTVYGASIYGTAELKQFGYIDYELFTGTFTLPERKSYFDELTDRYMVTHPLPGVTLSQSETTVRHIEGGMLVWNTPLDGFRLSATGLMGKADSSMPASLGALEMEIDSELTINEISVLSVEYDISDFTFTVERMRLDSDVKSDGGEFGFKSLLEGWYGAISWDVLDWLSLGTSYSEFYPDGNDKKGDTFKDAGQKDYYAWQKDITLSLKLNVTANWCFKFETHFIDGLGLAALEDNTEDPKQYWNLYAIKTSLNF